MLQDQEERHRLTLQDRDAFLYKLGREKETLFNRLMSTDANTFLRLNSSTSVEEITQEMERVGFTDEEELARLSNLQEIGEVNYTDDEGEMDEERGDLLAEFGLTVDR